ncbi:MAG: alpha/beta fold hydrolase [Candidatus Levybacteria bacterium]|nr:alpha/beta fold hydrolase [Candidatus Levybacteria bacterium]
MEKPIFEPSEKFVPEKINKTKKFLLLLGMLIVINSFVFGVFYFSVYKNKQSTPENRSLGKKSSVEISQTPFPFQEMTIPYLRARSYESSLGKLSQATETATYIGYLTSYDSDGLEVNGYLTIPKADIPENGWPAIIFVHGYIPPKNYRTLENYSTYVDYLAKNGFVVFKIDLRGHGTSEGEPGGGYYSSDYIIDVLNARAALKNSDFVNSEKIGLWGHSMAGNVVSRALAASPEISATVIFAGAVYTYEDFSQFRIQDSSYQPPNEDSQTRRKRNELFEKYGQFDPNSSFWKQVPMTNYLGDIKGAIQINHALDDNVVDTRYSRNFNSILDNTDIPHELNEYASGGHNFTGASFNQSMQNTVSFFQKYLK